MHLPVNNTLDLYDASLCCVGFVLHLRQIAELCILAAIFFFFLNGGKFNDVCFSVPVSIGKKGSVLKGKEKYLFLLSFLQL